MFSLRAKLHFLFSFVFFASWVSAQGLGAAPYDPSQFATIGVINKLSVDNETDLFSGGLITIDNIEMIIPKNTLVTLPSISVAWSELFVNGVPQMPMFNNGQSWEATVFGNRVANKHIVGLVYITQSSTRLVTGFINEINLETGEFRIGGSSDVPGSGMRCRLNDPVGRYGIPYTDNPLWTVDSESPSVTGTTGYPMCIPRYANGTDDPLCPRKNRLVNGVYVTQLQFKTAATRTARDPDPNLMAPLIVGDYVSLNGIFLEDGLLAVFYLNANLGYYTAPRERPSYITVEVVRHGAPIPLGVPAELGETRAVAYTTDPLTPMQWFAIDVDPCTGETTERNLMLVQPFSDPGGAVYGRALFRMGQVPAGPMSRSTGFRMLTGTKVTPNDLLAGTFVQPTFEFIMPELEVFGANMFPFSFSDWPYLGQGSGPVVTEVPGVEAVFPAPLVGQLSPWPGARAPFPVACEVTIPDEPPTSTLVTSVLPAPTEVPNGRDLVTIISVTEARGNGVIIYTIQAITSVTTGPFPTLTATGSGDNPLGQSPLTRADDGNYYLTVGLKRRLTSITVRSSLFGSNTVTF